VFLSDGRNASLGGPQENPMNEASDLGDPDPGVMRGVERRIDQPGDVLTDDWNSSEKWNGCETVSSWGPGGEQEDPSIADVV